MSPSQIAPSEHEELEPVGPRPKVSEAKRLRVFQREFGRCYLCKTKITVGEAWEVEHANQRALSGDDTERNLFPVHEACHAPKTADDARARAKVKRLINKNGPVEERKPPTQKLQGRGFSRRYEGL